MWRDHIDYFISKGANIKAKNKNGESVLYFVIRNDNGNVDQLKYLIEKGVSIFDKDNDGTPLIHTIYLSNRTGYSDRRELFHFLNDSGCDINETDNYGCHIVHIASKNYFDYDMAEFIVHNGADVFIKDKLGRDAIYYANKYANGRLAYPIQKAIEEKNKNLLY